MLKTGHAAGSNTTCFLQLSTHLLVGAATAWVGLTLPVAAQSMDPGWGVYGQAGTGFHSERNTDDVSVGFMAPLLQGRDWWNGKLSAHWDASLGRWRASAIGGGKSTYSQLSLIPTLRYRIDGGQSAWFIDAGLGLSVLDRVYATPDRTFSTRLNFSEVLAVGRNFGAQGQYEGALVLQHFSNAGIKEPNPGENFLQFRFALRF